MPQSEPLPRSQDNDAMPKKKKSQDDLECELRLKKEEIERKFDELAQFEKDLKSREDDLRKRQSSLFEWEGKIEKERRHLSHWAQEIQKVATRVAEDRRKVNEMFRRLRVLYNSPSPTGRAGGRSPP